MNETKLIELIPLLKTNAALSAGNLIFDIAGIIISVAFVAIIYKRFAKIEKRLDELEKDNNGKKEKVD
jgi:hypothetical protein